MKRKLQHFFLVLFMIACASTTKAQDTTTTVYSFWCSDGPVSAAVWYNDDVAVLVEGEVPSQRDKAKMDAFLAMMTNLYAKYAEVTGLDSLPIENPWDGRIVIQIPNDNCGAGGLASHGVLGISVGKSLFDEQQYERSLSNQLQQVFFYEAHRNFWPEWFNNKFDWAMDNNPDNWGWWTVGMNNAMVVIMAPLIGVEGMYGDEPGSQFRSNMLAQLNSCIEGGYNWNTGWTHAFMPWNPGESINDLMSGLLIHSFEQYGGMNWLAGFYAGLRDSSITDRSDVMAHQECRDNVYRIWSAAAGSNLSSYFEGTLQWPLSPAAKSWVADRLGLGSIPAAAERFAYGHLATVHNKNGGTGWAGKWSLTSANGQARMQAGSLQFDSIPSSGGRLRLEPATATPLLEVERPIEAVDSGEVWISYLVSAVNPGSGPFAIRLNGNSQLNIGKNSANQFSLGNVASSRIMQADSVYFVVSKIKLGAGNDTAWLWINPAQENAPGEGEADAVLYTVDAGSLSGISIAAAGPASIDIDEIRISDAYAGVASGAGLVPAAPANLVATVVSSHEVQLQWDDNAAIETGFRLQRKTTDGVYTNIATLQPDVTTYTDSGLSADSIYKYRVRAIGGGGVSGFSNQVTAMPGQFGAALHATEHFAYGSGPVHARNGGTGWNGAWNLETGNGTALVAGGSLRYPGGIASGGHLQLAPAEETPEIVLRRSFPQTDTGTVWIAYFVKGETVGDGHFFIRLNGNQNYALGKKWGNEFAIDNSGSGKVMNAGETNLVVGKIVLQLGEDSIFLWVNPPLSGEPASQTANVYKADTDLESLSYVDVNLQGYGLGRYDVDALNIARSFDDVTGKGLLPAAPAGLSASVSSPVTIDLAWTDHANNETGFLVQRKTTGAFGSIAQLPANTVSWQDTVAAANDSVYTYRVQSMNESGRSAFSVPVSAGGAPDSITAVAERFAYAADARVDRKNKGMGWKSPWDVVSGDSTVAIRAGSLRKSGIPASGGKLELDKGGSQPSVLQRSISPRGNGTYWLSYLLTTHAEDVNGYATVIPQGEQAFAAGKAAGAGMALGSHPTGIDPQTDSVYNVVLKIVLMAGDDSVYMWVNPATAAEPATATAHASSTGEDIGTLNFLEIRMQSAAAVYDLDEIRFSDTYLGAVTGQGIIPDAPVNLVASVISTTQVQLEWEHDDDSEQGFHIDQKASPGFDRIAVAEAGETGYGVGGLLPGGNYGFRVRAFNEAGFSAFAGPVFVATDTSSAMAPGPLQSDRRILMWISAHPDDELFGAHSAFARYLKDSLHFGHYINVTSGSVQYNPTSTVNYEHGTERMGEAFASANSVGADNRFMGMIDGQVSADAGTLEERLARAIREIQPDVIITHGPGGEYGNADHVATSAAVTAAVTSAALPGAFPEQLTEGLKVWNTPKYYRIKYDPYPSTDSLTLHISADDTSAVLNKTYYTYADETLRASHLSADAVGIFDIYPVPHYTKASLHYHREDVTVPELENNLLTGLPANVMRPLYIRNWVVAGSWPGNLSSQVLDTDEAGIADPLGQTNGGRTWTAYNNLGHSLVDFRKTFTPNTGAVAYAYTEVTADASTTFLRMAASNKYKIWLNGSLIASQTTIPDYDYERHIPVTLQEGVNRILVKMESGAAYAGLARPWGFFMKIGTGADSPAPLPDGQAQIVVLPTESAYNMGEAVIGDGRQNTVSFIIQNTDMADSLSISSVYLTGDNPGDYVIHDDSGEQMLAPGGKRTFNLSFDPGATGNKARVADIKILSGDVNKPEVSIRIFGDALQPNQGLMAKSAQPVEIAEREAVLLYPNPVSRVLRLDFAQQPAHPAIVRIVNLNGSEQYLNRNFYGGETIDVSGFAEGIYFVMIQIGNKTIVKKIIKLK